MSAREGGRGEGNTGSKGVCVCGGGGAQGYILIPVPRVGRTKACSTRSSCRLPKQLCHSDVLFCNWLDAAMGVWGQSLHGNAAPMLLLLCARCALTTR